MEGTHKSCDLDYVVQWGILNKKKPYHNSRDEWPSYTQSKQEKWGEKRRRLWADGSRSENVWGKVMMGGMACTALPDRFNQSGLLTRQRPQGASHHVWDRRGDKRGRINTIGYIHARFGCFLIAKWGISGSQGKSIKMEVYKDRHKWLIQTSINNGHC